MIGIKCAACGNAFEVPDDQSGKNIRCPNCKATVFVPTVGTSALETPASQAPTEKVEKPKHFLSPLEMVLILVILGIMIVFVVYRGVIEKTKPQESPDNVQAVREMMERERRIESACLDNMKKIAEALKKYREEHDRFPDDLSVLKEAGALEAGVPLFCEKSKYGYYKSQAAAAKGVVKDPILVADSDAVHRKGRNVVRVSGKVEFLEEEKFRDIIAAQQKEFAEIAKKTDKEARKKDRREREAGEFMVAAATAFQAGQLEEARKTYEMLLKEYDDTDVVNRVKEEIKSKIVLVNFTIALESTRVLVRQLRLDEAKAAYAKLAEVVEGDSRKTLEVDIESVKLIESGRALRSLGDLSGALEQYKKLGSTSADPFWKRMAHELSTEIEDYRDKAAALFASAEKALKAGRKVRALSLYMSLRDNYAHSAQAPKAPPIIAVLEKEVPYSERFLPKEKLVDKQTITAISDGLGWLAANQQRDGSWKSTSAGSTALDDMALTGLAALCFLAEGNTHLSGPYRGVVAGALNKLRSAQKDNGLIGDTASPVHHLSHALGLLVMCELRNMTDDDELTPLCQKAVNYAIKIQEPATGWRLGEKRVPSDIMLTTWMQLGMLSAATGELKFLRDLLKGALNTYDAASDTEGRVNYSEHKDPTRPQRHLRSYQDTLIATASATCGRLASGSSVNSPKLRGAIEFMRANLPNGTRTNFPYFLFGTYGLHQAHELAFREWNWALKSVLLPTQLREGTNAGAWDMGQFSDFRGGHVYPTALAILALQVPYNHFAAINLRARAKEVAPKGPEVTIVLQDGAQITGNLVSETQEKVVIEIVKGTTRAEMIFDRKDVKKIIRK